MNIFAKTVIRQRRGCDLSTLTTRIPSHPCASVKHAKAYRRVKNIGISAHFTHLLKFRNFVFATEVTIFSYHNPLMYLRECAPQSAKLTRWALGLQEFIHADSNIFHMSVNESMVCNL